MSVLAAERIKLTTTKSPWWCSAIVVVLGLGLAVVIGLTSKSSVNSYANSVAAGNDPGFQPFLPTSSDALGGVTGFGVLVLMILAALAVTSEYRFGIIRTTFQAMPNRGGVLVAKAGLIGVYAAVLSVVLALGAFYLAKATAGPDAGAALILDGSDGWRPIYSVPIYAFLCVFLAVGVGALVRQSAAAIALLLLWPLLIENLFNAFGSFGRDVMPFLPFLNANNFLGSPGGTDFHWGPWASLAYFAAWVVVIFGASVLVVNRRDA
ncbi:ABC transporter permease [Actinomycetes bacterium M1A6_2h]